MADANSICETLSDGINRLYDVGALISAAIEMCDFDSQEGNDLFRVLSIAKREVTNVTVELDNLATHGVRS